MECVVLLDSDKLILLYMTYEYLDNIKADFRFQAFFYVFCCCIVNKDLPHHSFLGDIPTGYFV